MELQEAGKRKYAWRECVIKSDERIRLAGVKRRENYSDELRLVTAVEVKKEIAEMSFFTNNFEWVAYSVCKFYQCRWGGGVFQGTENRHCSWRTSTGTTRTPCASKYGQPCCPIFCCASLFGTTNGGISLVGCSRWSEQCTGIISS